MTDAGAPARIRVGGDDPANSYDVVIGTGLLGDLAPAVAAAAPGAQRALLVRPTGLDRYADAVRDALAGGGYQLVEGVIPDAEAAKTAGVAADLWAMLGRAAFTRSDVVVTLGGGSVTDLGGFVAATWLRGVPVVHVPTTLLAMVDAAVGGKTGINTDEGKNLVGAFHPPAAVLCDLATLATLPEPDLRAGLAEVIKAGFIADPVILDLLDGPLPAWDAPALAETVVRSVQVKADVVTADLKESSLREILNYGHTFAHAVEQVGGYTWRHGDAVSVGMVYAAELGERAGVSPAGLARGHRARLDALGLPTSYRPSDPPGGAVEPAWERLLTAMGRDKKTRGSTLRFVVLEELGRPVRLVDPDPAALAGAYEAVRGG